MWAQASISQLNQTVRVATSYNETLSVSSCYQIIQAYMHINSQLVLFYIIQQILCWAPLRVIICACFMYSYISNYLSCSCTQIVVLYFRVILAHTPQINLLYNISVSFGGSRPRYWFGIMQPPVHESLYDSSFDLAIAACLT
jgi:hypothetical protein